MMFARAVDMEPGMMFRCTGHPKLLEFRGVESVVSRFPNRHPVRVLVGRGGVDFICDRSERFPIVGWRES